MENLIAQLEETNRRVSEGAREITRLKNEIVRLQTQGKDFAEVHRRLGIYHAMQLKLLAEQIQIRDALRRASA